MASTPRILVLADNETRAVQVGDVLEEDAVRNKFWVLNRASGNTRPFPQTAILKEVNVYIFPEDLVASDLKKVSLTDQQVYDIAGLIHVNMSNPAELRRCWKPPT